MAVNEKLRDHLHDQLFRAILELKSVEECYEFFEDLCTIQEMKAISARLEVARMLKAGDIYEDIVKKTGASTATISRIKRCLVYGSGGYELLLHIADDTIHFLEYTGNGDHSKTHGDVLQIIGKLSKLSCGFHEVIQVGG